MIDSNSKSPAVAAVREEEIVFPPVSKRVHNNIENMVARLQTCMLGAQSDSAVTPHEEMNYIRAFKPHSKQNPDQSSPLESSSSSSEDMMTILAKSKAPTKQQKKRDTTPMQDTEASKLHNRDLQSGDGVSQDWVLVVEAKRVESGALPNTGNQENLQEGTSPNTTNQEKLQEEDAQESSSQSLAR